MNSHRGPVFALQMNLALLLLALLIAPAGTVPAQAQTPTTLYSFINGSTDAACPSGNIVQGRDGNFYGVGAACGRGANMSGAVYKITTAGVESVLVNFPANWQNCDAGFTLGRDGNFYGICSTLQGTNSSLLFRMTPAGALTNLHGFAVGDEAKFVPIQGADGNFYGVTSNIVYKMTSAGVVTTIHTFAPPDVQPLSNIYQASDGSLYGTITLCALSGNRGCVYKVSTSGVYKNIYGFSDTSGSFPCTSMMQGKDGKLYGATDFGRPLNSGNIYKVTTAGVNTGLHDFNSVTDGGCNPGANAWYPVVSLLQVADGNFYGTTYGGALANNGSIYKLTPTNAFSVFLFPADNSVGNQPYTTMIQDTNGAVYGTTLGGGKNSVGTFFKVATGDAGFVKLEPSETSGVVGTSVGMFGQGFSSASVVKFGGIAATTKTLSGTTYLTAVVPPGAHTGVVTVTTGATSLTSLQTYKVKPKVTGISPTSGHVAQLVTINGTGFIQATAVKFGTVKATSFTVVSDSKVTAVVPTVPLGAVSVSITTAGGSASGATKFTVN